MARDGDGRAVQLGGDRVLARECDQLQLRLAEVLAWRGRAQSVRGRGASALVDTDAAVMTYLAVTDGTFDHPLAGGLAGVAAVHATVLARHGDPAMAVTAADFALAYYAGVDEDGQSGNAYLRDAALVSAMGHLSVGSIARGLDQAVIAAATVPRNLRHPALWERLRLLAELVDEGRVAAPSIVLGRDTADLLYRQLSDTGMPWCPDPARLGVRAPTLADAIIRAGGDAALVAAVTMNQPDGLLVAPSLRWLPSLPVGPVLRIAELAVGALAASPVLGMRLTLDVHAMFAAAHRRRADAEPIPFAAYGGPWLRLLEKASAVCARAGEAALAADLEGWAESIRARGRSARSA